MSDDLQAWYQGLADQSTGTMGLVHHFLMQVSHTELRNTMPCLLEEALPCLIDYALEQHEHILPMQGHLPRGIGIPKNVYRLLLWCKR